MLEAFGFDFMRQAVLVGVLAGIACGIIGTLVVVNRIVFVSGGIAHAAYGGVGLAFFLGIPPILGTLGFSVAGAAIMAAVSLRAKHRVDAIIGAVWAVGMAVGIILMDLTPGYHQDLMSYLFGSILTVPAADIWMMGGMDLFILLAVFYFYQDLTAMSYDEEFARVRGVPVRFLYFLLLIMIALAVVMIIRVVGLILVIALLSIPPYIAERFSGSMFRMMVISVALNLAFTLTGLWLSYVWNLTSGAAVIIVAAVCLLLVLVGGWLRNARRGEARG